MPIDKSPNAEPIRGYRLIEPIGSGGFGEVWKCEAPGGIFKAIKFVHGPTGPGEDRSVRADEELRALQHVKSIRHPFLLSIDRVEIVQDELVVVTELADHSLHQVLEKAKSLGKPGISRSEVLAYLREAAEVLDMMNHKFDLQHLDIKPRNLFLVSNHVKVADFGLVNSLSAGGKIQIGAITPLYAAPELFMNKISRHCDQYSLAIVYQELLTGTMPFGGKNSRQLLYQHTQAEPDLTPLPADERPIVARALAKNPDHRFPSCMALVRALSGEVVGGRPASEPEMLVSHRISDLAATQVDAAAAARAPKAPNLPPQLLGEFRFLECQGNNPLVETWKVQAGNGKLRQLKLLYGFNAEPQSLQRSVAQLKTLQHPGLVAHEVLHVDAGRVVVVCDNVTETVRDRFQKCHAMKLAGIPRAELIDYLRAAAEVLDYLHQQHGVQHLGLNPRSLVLDGGWLQLAEFGLAQLLWLPANQDIAQRNYRYCAPELFANKTSRSCDQFSLAVIYAELLTGQHPYHAVGNLARSQVRENPSLDGLAPKEQEVIRRALDPNPAKRWPSCTDMLLALEGPSAQAAAVAGEDRFDALIRHQRDTPTPVPGDTAPNPVADVDDLIRAIIGDAGDTAVDEVAEISLETDSISNRFQVGIPIGAARLKLDSFCRQWYGHVVRDDDRELVVHLDMPTTFLQQWFGRQPGLEVRVRLTRVNVAAATPIEVGVVISPFRCGRKRSMELMEDMGPKLIDSLRRHLLVNSEKRTRERLAFPLSIRVVPLHSDGTRDEPIECRGKDISHTGIGFYLPQELTTSEVLIELPSATRPPMVQVPAMLVRAKPCADGWYEVGAIFRVATKRKSSPDMALPPVAGK